ncbi:hypothetical protein IT575_02420 [bacterium]|nr:hypothetical protein [bacterium]
MPFLPALFILLQGTAQTPGMGQGSQSPLNVTPGTWEYALFFGLVIGWSLLTIWCVVDAFTHTDNGCLWTILLLTPLNPIVVPFYVFGTLYSRRQVTKRQLSLSGKEVETDISMRFASEIERAKFIQSAMKGGGTMYEPGVAVVERPEGRQHFRDERAESLLLEQRFEDAWNYLIDLYSLAREDVDFEREETYRSYLARIPQGLERLARWEKGLAADSAASAGPAAVPAPGDTAALGSGRASRRRDRSVPF